MSAEMSPEGSPTPDPGPTRRGKFPLWWMVANGLLMGLVFGYLFFYANGGRRTRAAQEEVLSWAFRVAKDNPSVLMGSSKSETSGDLLGTWCHVEGTLTTKAGRPIAFDYVARDRLFARTDRLVLTAEGRSVDWPIESIGRAQKVDLTAEFPEAFR